MHATMEKSCVDDILIAHPILQALFTFLQMHFLFVNSQVSPNTENQGFGLASKVEVMSVRGLVVS